MRFLLFFLALVLILAGAGAYNLHSFNQFSAIEPVPLAACAPVTGIAGPEDIGIDETHGLAFMSSLDRRAKGARGAIHAFDVADPLADSGWRDRTGGEPEKFRPLGLDYYENGEVRRLFVVNEAGPSIELYDVQENGDLVHLETFAERRLTSPNNVAAVGPRSFYVTNDAQPGRAGPLGKLHFVLRIGSGEVFYVDGSAWSIAAEGLRFANGLALTEDGAKLYVAETSGKALKVFDRDVATGRLTPSHTIALDASPDNINVDADGAIWVGALPKPLLAPRLLKDENARAPSEVIRVAPDGAVTTIYRNDGTEHSAATVAAREGGKLFIGALYEKKFLFCDLPKEEIAAEKPL
ncbi:MAG: SMP-30/gluconolactonase/LRE family protein [Parvularculaceae bacterium]